MERRARQLEKIKKSHYVPPKKLTRPVGFKFRTEERLARKAQHRKLEDQRTPFKELARAVQEYQSKTPLRFRRSQIRAASLESGKKEVQNPTRTVPQEFHFHGTDRHHRLR